MKNKLLDRKFRLWTMLLVVVPCLIVMAIYTAGQVKSAKRQILDQANQRVDLLQK